MDTGSQGLVFPDGHPSKYKPLLNFSERATELAFVATVILSRKYISHKVEWVPYWT